MTVEGPFAWKVVAAAFVVATLSWGLSLYGLIAFVKVITDMHDWPTTVVSGAVTLHFLFAAVVVAFLTTLHARWGLALVTFVGAIALAVGGACWMRASSPPYLYAAALLTGWGWATTGAAAVRAIVAPWFSRRRPMALGIAFSGATAGGIVFSPLWIMLIAVSSPLQAAEVIGTFAAVTVAFISFSVLRVRPALAAFEPGVPQTASTERRFALFASPRFATLASAYTLALFAQMGVALHMLAVLSPILGSDGAAWCVSLMSASVIAGRLAFGAWIGNANRRSAAAVGVILQGAGIALLATAGQPEIAAGACILFGLGGGQLSLALPLVADAEFAPADVPRVIAAVTSLSQAVWALAPGCVGLLHDLSGGYRQPLLAAAILQVISALVFFCGRIRQEAGGDRQ